MHPFPQSTLNLFPVKIANICKLHLYRQFKWAWNLSNKIPTSFDIGHNWSIYCGSTYSFVMPRTAAAVLGLFIFFEVPPFSWPCSICWWYENALVALTGVDLKKREHTLLYPAVQNMESSYEWYLFLKIHHFLDLIYSISWWCYVKETRSEARKEGRFNHFKFWWGSISFNFLREVPWSSAFCWGTMTLINLEKKQQQLYMQWRINLYNVT